MYRVYFLSLSLIRFAHTYIFSGLQFTNQIAVGGDNVDTVYFSLEPRDLVRCVGGGRKRRLGYSPGASREGKPGDVEIAIEKEGEEERETKDEKRYGGWRETC
jgi:hypothetical protein